MNGDPLTPVRIRGSKRSQGSSSACQSLAGSSPHKWLKKDVDGLPMGFKDALKLSSLERLPTELLECIFFQCLVIILPRASLHTGMQLASRRVKYAVYTLAFCPTKLSEWDIRPSHLVETERLTGTSHDSDQIL